MTDARTDTTIRHPVRRMIDRGIGIAVGEATWRAILLRPWFPGSETRYGQSGNAIEDAAHMVVYDVISCAIDGPERIL